MPQPANLIKAQLREIQWDESQQVKETGIKEVVQFNPQTLAVRFSNQVSGTEQGGGAARQFVGKGSTTLTLDLWFDVTAPSSDWNTQSEDDVRELTKKVVYFITPKKITTKEEGDKYIPPGLRFVWGTFMFDGIVLSMNEDLEFFSEDGKPLRSKINLTISQQEIQHKFNEGGAGLGLGLGFGAGLGISAGLGVSASAGVGLGVGVSAGASIGMAGTQPLVEAQAGVSIQGMAGSSGQTGNWKNIALANNIENPRQIEAGTLINTNVSGSFKVE